MMSKFKSLRVSLFFTEFGHINYSQVVMVLFYPI